MPSKPHLIRESNISEAVLYTQFTPNAFADILGLSSTGARRLLAVAVTQPSAWPHPIHISKAGRFVPVGHTLCTSRRLARLIDWQYDFLRKARHGNIARYYKPNQLASDIHHLTRRYIHALSVPGCISPTQVRRAWRRWARVQWNRAPRCKPMRRQLLRLWVALYPPYLSDASHALQQKDIVHINGWRKLTDSSGDEPRLAGIPVKSGDPIPILYQGPEEGFSGIQDRVMGNMDPEFAKLVKWVGGDSRFICG